MAVQDIFSKASVERQPLGGSESISFSQSHSSLADVGVRSLEVLLDPEGRPVPRKPRRQPAIPVMPQKWTERIEAAQQALSAQHGSPAQAPPRPPAPKAEAPPRQAPRW